MPSERRRGRVAAALLLVGGLALAAAFALREGPRSAAPPERIVLVVIDTLRRDFVSAYGGAVRTPVLDGLAARGQRFDAVQASFHQTSMSMGALFTGRTPSLERGRLAPSLPWNGSTWCGMARFRDGPGGDASCIPDALPTLAEGLRAAGYWTAGIASNELLFEPSGFARGFDAWVEVGASGRGALRVPRSDAWRSRTAPRVLEAVAEVLARRAPQGRLFLYVHLMEVHDYVWRRAPSRPAAYREAVAAADAALGELLALLEREGLLEGALVVVTSDHGERLGERHALEGLPNHRGNPSFQEVLEVPLVAAPALPLDPGRPLRGQDLAGILLEVAGGTPPAPPELAPGELLLGERHYRTYSDGRFKAAVRRRDGELALFDLERDPGERRNVAESHPDVLRRQLERIEELSRELASPETGQRQLSERDRARLEALGYLDDE